MTTAIVAPVQRMPAKTQLIDLATETGFEQAAQRAEHQIDVARRAAIAYEHFRYVTAQQIADFSQRLIASTKKTTSWDTTYDQLRFRPIAKYPNMPPQDVLQAVRAAQNMKVFDTFEVADIQSVRVLKDPIIFGCISNITDKFYIAQWGDDVKISDLLGEHEG
jgi:hypothetical protein